MSAHAFQPGADGFCAACQQPEAYCTGRRPRQPGNGRPAGDSAPARVTDSFTAISARQYGRSDSGDTGDTATANRTSWTAAELMAVEFPAPRWAVPGIVAEGVTVLAGAPKAGKSWLALGLGLACATGGKALGTIDVDAGPALYLALEDTGRRLQARLRLVLGDDLAPATLTLATRCPPLPSGGDALIAAWLDRNPGARLVVIDVLARIHGTVNRDLPAYDADYRAVVAAKSIADHYGVPFIIVHHTRKASATDFLDEVSGTQGVAGAADSVAVLKRVRGKADGILHITGRDVEEADYALTFAADTGAWQLSDTSPAEVALGDTRATIWAYVRQHPGARPKVIADGTMLAYSTVKQTARRMAADGQLYTDPQGGYYEPVTSVTSVTLPGQSLDSTVTGRSSLSPDEGEDE
jgi:AAA domain